MTTYFSMINPSSFEDCGLTSWRQKVGWNPYAYPQWPQPTCLDYRFGCIPLTFPLSYEPRPWNEMGTIEQQYPYDLFAFGMYYPWPSLPKVFFIGYEP